MGHWAGLKLDDNPQVVGVGTLDLTARATREGLWQYGSDGPYLGGFSIISAAVGWG